MLVLSHNIMSSTELVADGKDEKSHNSGGHNTAFSLLGDGVWA